MCFPTTHHLLSSSMFALPSLVMHLGLVLHHVLLNHQAFCLLPMNFTKICWCHPSFTTYHLTCLHFFLLTSSCGQPPLTMSTIIHCFLFFIFAHFLHLNFSLRPTTTHLVTMKVANLIDCFDKPNIY